MITQRKITIPIFEFKLTIVIFDSWSEIEHLLTPEEASLESRMEIYRIYPNEG